jgi:DNA-binding response OmpR family regulator
MNQIFYISNSNDHSLKEQLDKEGFYTIEIKDPSLALNLLTTNPSNKYHTSLLIYQDSNIDNNTINYVKELRGSKTIGPTTPIIFLTENQNNQNHLNLYIAGVNDCINTPVDHNILIAKIASYLQLHSNSQNFTNNFDERHQYLILLMNMQLQLGSLNNHLKANQPLTVEIFKNLQKTQQDLQQIIDFKLDRQQIENQTLGYEEIDIHTILTSIINYLNFPKSSIKFSNQTTIVVVDYKYFATAVEAILLELLQCFDNENSNIEFFSELHKDQLLIHISFINGNPTTIKAILSDKSIMAYPEKVISFHGGELSCEYISDDNLLQISFNLPKYRIKQPKK